MQRRVYNAIDITKDAQINKIIHALWFRVESTHFFFLTGHSAYIIILLKATETIMSSYSHCKV